MKLLQIIWLLTLSDGVASFIGARGAWRMRGDDHRRFELSVAFAAGLMCYSISQFMAVTNSVYHADLIIPPPVEVLRWSIVAAGLRSIGMWILALALLNGSAPGFVRRGLSRLLNLAR